MKMKLELPEITSLADGVKEYKYLVELNSQCFRYLEEPLHPDIKSEYRELRDTIKVLSEKTKELIAIFNQATVHFKDKQ